MTELARKTNPSLATLVAARDFNRRTLLQAGAAAAALTLAGPALIRSARSSSGELNLLMWQDEFPDPVLSNFQNATGIKVNRTAFTQNEEQITKLLATGGEGFDLCQPTRDRAPQYRDLGVLAAFDLNRLPNVAKVLPAMLEASTSIWTWDEGLHHLPHCWGTEAISWHTDKWTGDKAALSYGSLWDEGVKGHVQARPHSLLLGIGLWLDGSGKLPSNRMLDAYKTPEDMKRIYDQILPVAIEKKVWLKAFWDSAEDIKAGLLTNDIWIGQTWDGPALSLKKEGRPVSYQAPKEGAITWIDGIALTKAAKNIDQAYALIDYLLTPESSAAIAEGSGYNPVVVGADALLSASARRNVEEAYPGNALNTLWHRPPEPAWFAELRGEYTEKFKAA